MPRMAQDAVKGDPALGTELAGYIEAVARRWIDAGTMVAAVHLEPHVQPGPADRLRRLEIVEYHAQRRTTIGDALHVR